MNPVNHVIDTCWSFYHYQHLYARLLQYSAGSIVLYGVSIFLLLCCVPSLKLLLKTTSHVLL